MPTGGGEGPETFLKSKLPDLQSMAKSHNYPGDIYDMNSSSHETRQTFCIFITLIGVVC